MIEKPYLLVMNLPCYVDGKGRRWLDELWHKDLVEHLAHIRHLTLAAPLRHEKPAGKFLPIDHDHFEGTLVNLPPCGSTLGTLARFPRSSPGSGRRSAGPRSSTPTRGAGRSRSAGWRSRWPSYGASSR